MMVLLRAFAIVAGAVLFSVPQAAGPSIHQALDSYSRGDHARAAASVDAGAFAVDEFLLDATRWVERGEDETARRSREVIAAAFALDVVAASMHRWTWGQFTSSANPDLIGRPLEGRRWPPRVADAGAALPVVAWGCERLRQTKTTREDERWWWLASIGLLQAAGEWTRLLGAERVPRRANLPGGKATLVEIREGHLSHARDRFPQEPRFRLAEAIARAALVMDPKPAQAIGPPVGGAFGEGPGYVLGTLEEWELAGGNVGELQRAFEALTGEASLEAEARIRLGYLHLRRKQWRQALESLDRGYQQTDERFLQAVADYFRGWVHQRMENPRDALAAYERAHALAPGSRHLMTLLAAQRYLANERAEAHELVSAGMRGTQNAELLVRFQAGDARLIRKYVARMRELMR